MFAHERDHSLATKRAPNNPRFQGAKSPAKLNAVVHVVFFGLDGVGPQIFRHQCKDAAQAFEVADTEIQRDIQGLMRIDDDGVRFIPTSRHPFKFRQHRKSTAISAIDVQPHLVFAANLRDLRNGIDTGGRCRSNCRDNRQRLELLAQVALDHRAQRGGVHSEFGIARYALHVVLAQAERDRRFLGRTMRLIGCVNAKDRGSRTDQSAFASRRRGFFARNRKCVHDSDRRRIVNNAVELVRQSQPLPQPIDHDCLQFGCRGRRPPRHRVHVERRSNDLAKKSRPGGCPSEVAQKHRMAPMHHAGKNHSVDIGENVLERFAMLRRLGRKGGANRARFVIRCNAQLTDIFAIVRDPISEPVKLFPKFRD